jgi:hypothetical protein
LSSTGLLLDGNKQKDHLNTSGISREIANGRNRCLQFNCGRLGACFKPLFGFHIFPDFSLSLSKIPHLAGAAATKKRAGRLYLLQR